MMSPYFWPLMSIRETRIISCIECERVIMPAEIIVFIFIMVLFRLSLMQITYVSPINNLFF